jgi:hypothetical protein
MITKRLRIVCVVAALSVALLGWAASEATPVQILKGPDQFDGKVVTLLGTVTNLDTRASRRGNSYYTFDLAGGGWSIKVISFGRPPCRDGSIVIVEGVFQQAKRVSDHVFYNEVKARRVSCR